jgi:hypothetical protein
MFVCGLRVLISCHVALLDRGGSIKEGHFVCEFYRRMDTVGMFEKFIKLFQIRLQTLMKLVGQAKYPSI